MIYKTSLYLSYWGLGTGDWGLGNFIIFLLTQDESFSPTPHSPLSTPYSHLHMNQIFDQQMMAERLESLKAGIIGGLSLGLAYLITSLINTLALAKYFPILVSLHKDFNGDWLLSGAIAGFSGLLFGATYRYIIRKDHNPHLKSGGVLAFGLVRGLTQIELGWNASSTVLPFVVLASESILWFAIAAIALDQALQFAWVKPFSQ